MFVAWLQDCFIDARHYAVTLITQCRVPPLMMMTLMTKRRGEMKARTGMRTQDPRLAQHCTWTWALPSSSSRPRTEGRSGFSSPRMLSSQTHCSQKRGMGDGAIRRNTESQGPQQPVEADKRKPLSPYYNDVLDAVQPRVEAKKMLSSLLQFATCTILGYAAI